MISRREKHIRNLFYCFYCVDYYAQASTFLDTIWTQISRDIPHIILHCFAALPSSLLEPCFHLSLHETDRPADFDMGDEFHVGPFVNSAGVHLQKFAELFGCKKPIHSSLGCCG